MSVINRIINGKVPELPPGVAVGVGWLPGAKYEDGTPVAGVAAVHEYGLGVPARSFMRPTVTAEGRTWGQAVVARLQQGATLQQAAATLGGLASGDMQKAISQLRSPPLAEATLYARQHRHAPPPNSSTKPLVDTRVMMQTLTFEVTENDSARS